MLLLAWLALSQGFGHTEEDGEELHHERGGQHHGQAFGQHESGARLR